MKILFAGDYSNLHGCLAGELSRRGHEVTVISDRGKYLESRTDIPLIRKPGILGGFSYLYRLLSILPELKGYDVVQLINTNFFDLRPGKIKYFYDRLRDQNGSTFLTLASDDYYFVKACADAKIFRFSEFKTGKEFTEFGKTKPERYYGWLSQANRKLADHIYENINGAMAVLPEYDMAARPVIGEKTVFTNLPVDLSYLPYSPLEIEDRLKLFIGIRGGMEIQKGTKNLLAIARELEREMPGKVTVDDVRNLPLKEYLERMKGSHMVLDQFYAYSPATNALQAMALGKVAASGAQPEFYEYLGKDYGYPVFSLSPLEPDTKERLAAIIENPDPLTEMSRNGRKLVEENNDVKIVADRFLAHWEEKA